MCASNKLIYCAPCDAPNVLCIDARDVDVIAYMCKQNLDAEKKEETGKHKAHTEKPEEDPDADALPTVHKDISGSDGPSRRMSKFSLANVSELVSRRKSGVLSETVCIAFVLFLHISHLQMYTE